MSVNQDGYAKVYLPLSAAQWAELDGVPSTPTSYWLASQASGTTLADLGTGGRDVTIAGSPTLGAAAPGFQSAGIKCTDGSTTQFGTFSGEDVDADNSMLLTVWGVNSNPTATRRLNNFGDSSDGGTLLLTGTSGPKIGAISGANTASGTANYSSILVAVTKLDRTNLVLGTYTRGEQIKATWSAPVAATTSYLFGHDSGSSDATFVYGAYWSGTSAEIGDSQIQDLIDAVYGDSTTLSKMQAGSMVGKLVAAIEGCEYLLTEDCEDAALQAWAGSDWTSALGGLRAEIKNSQTLEPWEPFTGGGSCQLRIAPDRADTFGELVNKRLDGAETELTVTADRNDTTLTVAATTDFLSSGTAYIGTEAVGYTGTTATTLTGCIRGKWSPFGCAASGSGGTRFGNHHRVGQDPYHVQLKPIITQLPRIWIGKRVGVWLHTYDPVTGTLNSRDEAQLLFAGRIAGIADDANTFETVLDVEPIHDEIRNGTIGRDMWSCTIAEGLYLVEGRAFGFEDWKFSGNTGSPGDPLTADPLTVVASGATGTNQMNAGRYSLGELCEKLSAWLAGEKAAGRIHGFYNVQSPVTSNVGLRSKIYWRIDDGDDIPCSFGIDLPGEVMAFLGLTSDEPAENGQTSRFSKVARTDKQLIAQGECVPYVNLVFKPLGPGRLAQEFSDAIQYTAENEQGVFVDQFEYMPSVIKAACDATKQWGLFLLNDTTLIVGSYEDGVIGNCWLAPFQPTAERASGADMYVGRRADEPEGGPITLRQVFVLEASLATLFQLLIYGTGTSGYNHADFDTLPFGLGLGIPGELLGGDFERSLTNMPGADAPAKIVLDEPKKFTEIFSGDLVFRRAFLRWKDEGFEFAQWKTPTLADSVGTLTESNKAAPAGHQENHRVPSLESSEAVRPIVKVDYCRDFSVGRTGEYLKSVQIEDQTAVDDAGGNVKPFTIQLPNVYHDLQNSGAAVESLLPEFIAFMPVFARPFRKIVRSIDLRYFEGYSVGDVMTVTDGFARDPLTGRRGTSSRPMMITRISYDIGGSSADGSTRPMGGEVELSALDLHRGELYAPAAQVDDTATNAGYDAGTKTLTFYAHKYSHAITITKNWGRGHQTVYVTEDADATWLEAGDKVNVIEMDPADPASPLTWSDTIVSQTGNTVVLTTGLAGWDSTKKYRVVPQKYSEVTATQQDYCYQADDTDRMVEDLDPFFHQISTTEPLGYERITGSEKAELIPDMAYGDGRPFDVGYDRAIATGLNNYIDRKSAHQNPSLWWESVVSSSAESESIWMSLFAGPVYLGQDLLSTAITRTLTVAPLWRSASGFGADAFIRMTLTRIKPQIKVAEANGYLSGAPYGNPLYTAESSQTAIWTTSGTDWQTGEDKTLSINAKDLTWGYAWLVIEGMDGARCMGLAKCIEGPRET